MVRAALFVMTILTAAGSAAAGELTLHFNNGRVTLAAKEVPLRQILAEWARLGNTTVVNADKVPAGPVTLQLSEVPEKQALEVLLRSAAGYVAAPRRSSTEGPSQFARILVMPPSSAPPPRPGNFRPPVMRPPVMLQAPVPQVLTDDQGNPVDPNGAQPGVVQPVDPNMPEGEEGGEGAGVPVPTMTSPGIQPMPAAGDPPPPDDAEAPESVDPTTRTGMPTEGTLVSPTPRQLPVPSPNRRRR